MPPLQRRTVQGRGRRLVATEERRSHLYGARPQSKGGSDALSIDYASCSDDRDRYCRHYLWQKGKGALLQAEILTQEVAAMATRLQSLGDDGIGSVVSKPLRFCHRGGAGKHFCACGFYLGKQLGLGQAEVETDHGRPELCKQSRMLIIEGGPSGSTRRCSGIHPKLGVIG